MSSQFTISNYFNAHTDLFSKLDYNSIEKCTQVIIDKINTSQKIITCGNGGSAHNASHYITDWNKMYTISTGKKLNGFSLCDNVGLITAYANDTDYQNIFAGQLQSILSKKDLLISISGSGNSKNVVNATNYANSIGADTMAIVGYDGGELKKISDYVFHVPSFDMQLCEDIHLMFGHMVMKSICKIKIYK